MGCPCAQWGQKMLSERKCDHKIQNYECIFSILGLPAPISRSRLPHGAFASYVWHYPHTNCTVHQSFFQEKLGIARNSHLNFRKCEILDPSGCAESHFLFLRADFLARCWSELLILACHFGFPPLSPKSRSSFRLTRPLFGFLGIFRALKRMTLRF